MTQSLWNDPRALTIIENDQFLNMNLVYEVLNAHSIHCIECKWLICLSRQKINKMKWEKLWFILNEIWTDNYLLERKNNNFGRNMLNNAKVNIKNRRTLIDRYVCSLLIKKKFARQDTVKVDQFISWQSLIARMWYHIGPSIAIFKISISKV